MQFWKVLFNSWFSSRLDVSCIELPMYRDPTLISPSVRVAVLPVIMSMRVPEISRDSVFLMRRNSFFRLSVEKATAKEMASGIPSGTQTMSRVTAI